MRRIVRPVFLLAATVGCTLVSIGQSGFCADNYPSKPIELTVGYKAGGGADTAVRMLAKPLGEILGQPVVVLNKGGAGGRVAIKTLKNAKPDGYKLVLTTAIPYTFIPNVQKVKYTLDDFQFVASICKMPHMAMISSSEKPWRDFKGLLNYAKDNPGATWASISPMDKTVFRYIGKVEGIQWNPVPVKGGAGMLSDVLGGHVDFAFGGGIHYSYAKAGKMNVLAMFGAERVADFPDVPTFKELGYDISIENFLTIAAPKGLAPEITQKLADAIAKAVKDPAYVELLENQLHFPPVFMGPEQLKEQINRQSDATKSLIERLGN